MTTRVPSTWCV